MQVCYYIDFVVFMYKRTDVGVRQTTHEAMMMPRTARQLARLATILMAAAALGCTDALEYPQIALSLEVSSRIPFGYIGGIRELSDRRVVVADPLGIALVTMVLGAGTADTIGRVGSGPEEYRQPDRVLALPGDSTLLVDLGNSRLSVLDPDGRFCEHYPIARQTASGGQALIVPRFTDRLGRLYFLAEGAGGHRIARGAVARFDRTTRSVDTLALVALPDRSRPPPPTGAGPAIPPDLFEPRDDWAVAEDGGVATVSSRDYAITWVLPSGNVVRGNPVSVESVRVEDAHREELLEQLMASQLTMRSGGESGGIGMSRGAGGGRIPDVDRIEWPETLPLIRPGRVVATPDGFLWTERYVLPGHTPVIDVFNREGAKTAEIALPVDRRVVGFGAGTVYLARKDETGLEWLERYHLPS